MNLDQIRAHWQDWATRYGTDLRATTKTSTLKTLELDALCRALQKIAHQDKTQSASLRVLEMGSGNGQNCLYLCQQFPSWSFTGIDYIAEMVISANALKAQQGILDQQLQFMQGNVLQLNLAAQSYDIIFTDRCLINLNTTALQQQAIQALTQVLIDGGHLLMIENSQHTYDLQNQARTAVGLASRTPAEFNHFFDEAQLLPFFSRIDLQLLEIEDFISLHDLMLYVLVPMMNGGKVDYEHPLVAAATQLNQALSTVKVSSLGSFGQNRLYHCRKASTDRKTSVEEKEKNQ
jgi:ubiquinone/menaquinone biosynthesis C-methylase UbiE